MKKDIVDKIEKVFLNTIQVFMDNSSRFYLERDVEAYMYHKLAEIKELSEQLYSYNNHNNKGKILTRTNVLLHTQYPKFKRRGSQEGYFDITILDEKDITLQEYPDIFIAIELKKGEYDICDNEIISDIENLVYPQNKIKHPFVLCLSDLEKSFSEEKIEKLNLQLRRISNFPKNKPLYYFFANCDWDNPNDKGFIILKIYQKGDELKIEKISPNDSIIQDAT